MKFGRAAAIRWMLFWLKGFLWLQLWTALWWAPSRLRARTYSSHPRRTTLGAGVGPFGS